MFSNVAQVKNVFVLDFTGTVTSQLDRDSIQISRQHPAGPSAIEWRVVIALPEHPLDVYPETQPVTVTAVPHRMRNVSD